MTTQLRTLADIEMSIEAKEQELKHVEKELDKLHDREGQVRTELQHLEIQRTRLQNLVSSQ